MHQSNRITSCQASSSSNTLIQLYCYCKISSSSLSICHCHLHYLTCMQRYTYLRTGRSLVATYFISAFWHGLYPGFFLFFMSIPLMTNIERLIKVGNHYLSIIKTLQFNSIQFSPLLFSALLFLRVKSQQ